MTDCLMYWKFFRDEFGGDPRGLNFEWHSNNPDFLNAIGPGDFLWVVVSAGEEHPDEWRLLQRIKVQEVRQQRLSEDFPYHTIGDPKQSPVYDITTQSDLTPLLQKLEFASGKRIKSSGRLIGRSLESFRPLSHVDIKLLEGYAKTLNKLPNPAIQHWWVTASDLNPHHAWRWEYLFKDPEEGYGWGGPKWIKSTVSRARIRDMRAGDIIVAYQANEGIAGLFYLDSNGYPAIKDGKYDMFDIRAEPRVRLEKLVPYEEIRSLPDAERDFEFVRAKRGTVFCIIPIGFAPILNLILKHNPQQHKEVAEFLSFNRPILEAEVLSVHNGGRLKKTQRRKVTTRRVIRDTAIGRMLKQMYQYECQICGSTIELPDGKRYAEIHHLRPLGKQHHGKDGAPNIIVVCPHHHAMLDLGAIAIDPESMIVKHWNPNDGEGDSGLILKHRLDKPSLEYHFRIMFKGIR